MKFISALLLVSALSSQSTQCNKKADAVPPCIEQKIALIKAEPKWNPPAEVHEYLYQGKKVYLFSSNCCDQYNPLYDSYCNYICAPSGGLTGKGDGKCSDFNSTAQHIRLIWKDQR